MQYLAFWAEKLSWQEVARVFKTSWEKVFSSVEYIVAWGLAHRSLENISAIGVDEVAWQKGHRYLTVTPKLIGTIRDYSGLARIERNRLFETSLTFSVQNGVIG